MSQPAVLPSLSAIPTDQRHLRVVASQGDQGPLVSYLVLAPEGTPPAELFSARVTVRPVDPLRPVLPPPTGSAPPSSLLTSSGPSQPQPQPQSQPPSQPQARARGRAQSARTSSSPVPSAISPGPGAGADEGGVRIDHERYVATVDGDELDLTYLEFELLAHLVAHPQRVHSRAALVAAVWGYDYPGDGRTVDVHVARLRRKLGAAYRASIVTVRRVGYKYLPAGQR